MISVRGLEQCAAVTNLILSVGTDGVRNVLGQELGDGVAALEPSASRAVSVPSSKRTSVGTDRISNRSTSSMSSPGLTIPIATSVARATFPRTGSIAWHIAQPLV